MAHDSGPMDQAEVEAGEFEAALARLHALAEAVEALREAGVEELDVEALRKADPVKVQRLLSDPRWLAVTMAQTGV